ncbi:MAG: heme ABC exporter ATP-binding protein CcmA [Rhodothermales bacterium]|nr:heme ABC exporter ATP-binding protein CcmA [Rhodothermales bacterium]
MLEPSFIGRAVTLKLTAKDLGKRFGPTWVFRDLSVSISGGQSLAVTGRNGSGKSTLLRILSGLLRPSTGSVALFRGTEELEPQHHVHAVGFVSPTLSFYKKMTARENLRFVSQVRGSGDGPKDFAELFERVGLRGREDDLVGSYSSGMLQRLRLAAALVHSPSVLLLDEPFSNLDEQGFAIVESIMNGHTANGGVVVLATNSATEAQLCQSSIVIPEIN